MDEDTQKELSDTEEIRHMVMGRGWALVRQKFIDKIVEYDSIGNVQGKSDRDIAIDMKAREAIGRELYNILQEVEGDANSLEDKQDLVTQFRTLKYVRKVQ